METSFHKAVILSEEEENPIFRLCHVKATACQEESTPEAKYAVLIFHAYACVYWYLRICTWHVEARR